MHVFIIFFWNCGKSCYLFILIFHPFLGKSNLSQISWIYSSYTYIEYSLATRFKLLLCTVGYIIHFQFLWYQKHHFSWNNFLVSINGFIHITKWMPTDSRTNGSKNSLNKYCCATTFHLNNVLSSHVEYNFMNIKDLMRYRVLHEKN